MKKNVFSRAMAVLASMAVLGAASMMTASAAGMTGGSVEAKPGDTVNVPFTLEGVTGCAGAELTFTAAAPLTVVSAAASMADTPVDGGIAAVFVAGGGWSGTTVSVKVAADAAPGSYPVNVAITEGADGIDDGQGGYLPTPTMVAGTVVVPEEQTEPEPTEPEPTAAPTTVADTTAAPKPTTVKAATTSAPKTGTAGVAVAVAGLVTAGATAVVLKKKH